MQIVMRCRAASGCLPVQSATPRCIDGNCRAWTDAKIISDAGRSCHTVAFPVRRAPDHLIGKLADFIMRPQRHFAASGAMSTTDRHGVQLSPPPQRSAGGTGKFAQLALIARFCRQRVTLFFRHNGCRVSLCFYAALYASPFRLLHGWLCADSMKDLYSGAYD